MAAPVLAVAAKWAAKKFAKKAVGAATGTSNESSGGNAAAKQVGIAAVVGIIGVVVMMIVSLIAAAVSLISVVTNVTAGAAAVAMSACNTNMSGTYGPSDEAEKDIPPVALKAYQRAGTATGIEWTYIAAIGKIESDHGRYGGRHLNQKGDVKPTGIIGIPLNGSNNTQAIRDTDNGKFDGDTVWDRAVGVVQFIPSTWKNYAKDGDSDGDMDPQNVYDGAMATGFYLKASGAPAKMHDAIWAYNHSEEYVSNVQEWADKYRGSLATSANTSVSIKGSISIAHANVPGRSGDAGLRTVLGNMLSRKPDLVTLNEQSSRSLALIESAAPGYQAHRDPQPPGPDGNEAMGNVVLWRADAFTKISGGRVQLVNDDHTFYKKKPVTWDRYATWATLRRKSDGATVSIVSTHMMTNPEKYGPDKPTRQAQYSRGMDLLLGLVSTLSAQGPVFVGGDMNTHNHQTYPWTARTKMSEAGFGFVVHAVDFIFYDKSSGVTVTAQTTGPTVEPDHHWMWARFAMGGGATGGPGGSQPGDDTVTRALPAAQAAPMAAKPEGEKSDSPWVQPLKGDFIILSGFNKAGDWSGGWGLPDGRHQGQDYDQPDNSPVYAIGPGKVVFSPSNEGWAGPNLVQIDHGNGVLSWYAHMSSRSPGIKPGATVEAGQQVGTLGNMGRSYGAHLHLQITVNNIATDPVTFLAGAGVPIGSVGSDSCGPTGSSGVVGGNGQWGGYTNGNIPLSAMCQTNFQKVYLECNAANALNALNAAYKQKFKRSLGDGFGVGGYRSYADQVICQIEKGNLCATPGTSNHGWGLAADFSNGQFQSHSTADYKWMVQQAPNYGWTNPNWARSNGSKPEPWHFEFVGTGLNSG